MTSAPLVLSRLPVGSSARMQRRLGDQGAGDGHALLLAAGELGRLVVRRSPRPEALERLARHGPRARLRRTPW